MRIRIAVPDEHVSPEIVDPVLEAVTRINQHMLASGQTPTSDELIRGGARWRPENLGDEHFDHGATIAQRGWGDCDDWAPLHAATLRATGQDPGAVARIVPSGPSTFHAMVQRSNGQFEQGPDDISVRAGMQPSRTLVVGDDTMTVLACDPHDGRPYQGQLLPTVGPLSLHCGPQFSVRGCHVVGAGPLYEARVDVPLAGSPLVVGRAARPHHVWVRGHWRKFPRRVGGMLPYALSVTHLAGSYHHAVQGALCGAVLAADASGLSNAADRYKLLALNWASAGLSPGQVRDALMSHMSRDLEARAHETGTHPREHSQALLRELGPHLPDRVGGPYGQSPSMGGQGTGIDWSLVSAESKGVDRHYIDVVHQEDGRAYHDAEAQAKAELAKTPSAKARLNLDYIQAKFWDFDRRHGQDDPLSAVASFAGDVGKAATGVVSAVSSVIPAPLKDALSQAGSWAGTIVHGVEAAVSLVPGLGTGVSDVLAAAETAFGTAMTLLGGGSALEAAIRAAYNFALASVPGAAALRFVLDPAVNTLLALAVRGEPVESAVLNSLLASVPDSPNLGGLSPRSAASSLAHLLVDHLGVRPSVPGSPPPPRPQALPASHGGITPGGPIDVHPQVAAAVHAKASRLPRKVVTFGRSVPSPRPSSPLHLPPSLPSALKPPGAAHAATPVGPSIAPHPTAVQAPSLAPAAAAVHALHPGTEWHCAPLPSGDWACGWQ
jgi:hypothetical protein